MVIDQTGGLQDGIQNGGSAEFKTALDHVF